jgi:hypothetical protein
VERRLHPHRRADGDRGGSHSGAQWNVVEESVEQRMRIARPIERRIDRA